AFSVFDGGSKMTRLRGSGRFSGIVNFASGVFLGLTLGGVLASAGQPGRHDGMFWKGLASHDKTAYVTGYSDAARASLSKFDQLKVAAALFHWKDAIKVLDQVSRGMDLSNLPANDLVAYLDSLYSNSRYGDFEVANAIELAVMRGVDAQLPGT